MEKMTGLTSREASDKQPLDGIYRVTVDINIGGDKTMTLSSLKESVRAIGNIDCFYIERVSKLPTFEVGDAVELDEPVILKKCVFMDGGGNLVITDFSTNDRIENLGEFEFTLPAGTVAEVNKVEEGADNLEILFTGSAVDIPSLNKMAYLGILNIPAKSLNKYEE